MPTCDRPARCRHDRVGHCCICLDCARFEREPDWCIRCGYQQLGIGWNAVCDSCALLIAREEQEATCGAKDGGLAHLGDEHQGCVLPKGHESRFHQEWRNGVLLAEWSGP